MEREAPRELDRALRSDRVAGLLLALLGAASAAEALRQLPIGSLANPGPAYAPVLIGGLLVLLGIVTAAAGRHSPHLARLDWSELPHALRVLAGMVFAALALEPLGFRLTALALLLFYLGIAERRPLAATLAWSFGLALATHYLFVRLLRVPLPIGLFGI
jgi:putative tricarboxylic transport membrane protein